jgi:hypothetical protein
MTGQVHPCSHCAARPNEQQAVNTWADQQFGRPSVTSSAARLNAEAATMVRFAVSGDADLIIDQLAFIVVLAYRIAGSLESDLWEQTTGKVEELQGSPELLEPF